MPPPIYINTLVVCIKKRGKFGLDRPSVAAELMCYILACHFDFIFVSGYRTGKLTIPDNIQRACCCHLAVPLTIGHVDDDGLYSELLGF